MKVAIIDFETTGVDVLSCRPIEVGLAITDNKFCEVSETYSTLVWSKDYPEITAQIEELTNIKKADVISIGLAPLKMIETIFDIVRLHKVELMVAFNADFDRQVFNNECKRHGLGDLGIPWLCAMKDVKSNYDYKCWKLSHLALDYGVPIDPKDLHRAMADVYLTIDMLRCAGADAVDMLAFHKMPWIIIEAITQPPWKDGGKSTALAKEKGYSWEVPRRHLNGAKYPKKWVKAVREEDLEKELNETLFQVKRVL